LNNVLNLFELTTGDLLGIAMANASPYYSITRELQSTLGPSGIEWPPCRKHIPCMIPIIPLAFAAFMSSHGVKDLNKL
jgi:hypothetical protein